MLGRVAVAIWFDSEPETKAELEDWHSREHMPERLRIPGFLRGRRCRSADEAAAWPYFILYEVGDASVMTSPAYLERLNNPTPWSRKMFASCRLSRTLCRVVASRGKGVGGELLALQNPGEVAIDAIASTRGVTGVHLLERDTSLERPRTHEESLRHGGADESVERVLIVEGHDLRSIALPGERFRLSHVVEAS